MRRPDRKRVRPSVQPRLTAFLQPALKASLTSEKPSTKLVVVDDKTDGGQIKSNGGEGQSQLREAPRGRELALDDRRTAESRRYGAPFQSEFDTQPGAEQMAITLQAGVASPGEELQAGSDDPIGICEQPRHLSSSKGSLEAFIKRRKIAPQRDSSVEPDGEKARATRAALGRAVNGSAYAQCPLCTVCHKLWQVHRNSRNAEARVLGRSHL